LLKFSQFVSVVMLMLAACSACPSSPVSLWCCADTPLRLETGLFRRHNALWSACWSRLSF